MKWIRKTSKDQSHMIDRAFETIYKAIEADKKMRFEDALREYQLGVEYFLIFLKCNFLKS